MLVSQGPQPAPWQEETRIRATQRRTLRVLAAAQIVGGVGVGVASSFSSLLAGSVAHNATYAGLGRTATTAGAAAVGVPLAYVAQRYGRRSALSAGWLAAAAGGVILVVATVITLLAGLAAHAAVALRNAELFAQHRAALAEARMAVVQPGVVNSSLIPASATPRCSASRVGKCR